MRGRTLAPRFIILALMVAFGLGSMLFNVAPGQQTVPTTFAQENGNENSSDENENDNSSDENNNDNSSDENSNDNTDEGSGSSDVDDTLNSSDPTFPSPDGVLTVTWVSGGRVEVTHEAVTDVGPALPPGLRQLKVANLRLL